jgi:hypothetical protein
MIPPTGETFTKVNSLIDQAMASVKEGEKGALVWIAHKKGNDVSVNLAYAQRVGDHVEVTAYFGKTWGEPTEAGIAGRIGW